MWTNDKYRWCFIDMHIGWENEEYLSRLNAEKMIALVKEAEGQTILVKCRPWSGLAYFPTEFGKMHPTLKKQQFDYVGTMTELARKNGLAVKGYFSQIYDNYAYDHHPDWRCIDQDGKQALDYHAYSTSRIPHFERARYAMVCPNNREYRAYAKNCVYEIVSKYKFDSIFLDMPLWPTVCFCASCRKRYYEETGREMPQYVDWDDAAFRDFQQRRELWLSEFTKMLSDTVKEADPECTCEHNQGCVHFSWISGHTDLVNESCDYVGGDTYDSYFEQSFFCKYYKNISKSLPFVFISSRCDRNLSYHTTTKAMEQLVRQGFIALEHNGAFSICDGIDPSGELCASVYQGIIKNCFAATRPYEPYVNGNYLKNAAVWYPSHSKYDRADNGKRVIEAERKAAADNQFYHAKVAAGRILGLHNIPYDVVASQNLKNLQDDLLIISDVANIRDEEMEAIETYIRNGGHVYLSGKPGHVRLLELLEAEDLGDTAHYAAYMVPTEMGKKYFREFDSQSPMYTNRQARLRFYGEQQTLATLALPYTAPYTHDYAAIHSDPPGVFTDEPCAVLKTVGKGSIFWVGGPIEMLDYYSAKLTVGRIFKSLCGELVYETEAPVFVEVMSWLKDGRQYISAVNMQDVMPPATMSNVSVTLPYEAASARLLNSDRELETEIKNGSTRIQFPAFTMFEVAEIVKRGTQ
ncbi:alpha-amylase family protein [Ruminococcus gauvreauii]|uniref:Alpha-L-fucosidase n=1 Tax=Ruminococcus gauvreauii TaxID=438033 RepID=A0ABY5VFP5_9FIRM|nr:alpha-amylase family protein [Ruminococcus gauvreauii]UWP58308.1 alpha-L-fucosidase [Ruminococcus gauvreauii]